MELTTDAAEGAWTLAVSKHLSARPSMGKSRRTGVWSSRELQLNFSKMICAVHYISERQQKFFNFMKVMDFLNPDALKLSKIFSLISIQV